jgi:hypothetical protein
LEKSQAVDWFLSTATKNRLVFDHFPFILHPYLHAISAGIFDSSCKAAKVSVSSSSNMPITHSENIAGK